MLMPTEPSTPTLLLPALEFAFIRHGETQWNTEGRIQGHTDTSLNLKGVEQAHEAAENIFKQPKPVTMIVSSTLNRAVHTGMIIANHLGLPLLFDENLKERKFGAFEGKLRRDLEIEQNLAPGTSMTHMVYPPDAETATELEQRILNSIGYWLNKHPRERILFVSHGGCFRSLHTSLGIKHTTTVKNAHPYNFIPTPTGWSLHE